MRAVPVEKPTSVRCTQAATLLAGAVAIELVLARGSAPFYWTPLAIGLTYLLAALAGGRDGGHWPTALVLLGWGAGAAWYGHVRPADIDPASVYFAGAGVGVLLAAFAVRNRVVVSQVGLGAVAAVGGTVLALTPRVSELDDARTYALFLVVVAVGNAVIAAKGTFSPRAAS